MTNLPEINPFVGPRPRDHIEDQLTALRGVIRRRNEQTGRRHFVHEPWCRASYVRWIIETRRVLRAEQVKVYERFEYAREFLRALAAHAAVAALFFPSVAGP